MVGAGCFEVSSLGVFYFGSWCLGLEGDSCLLSYSSFVVGSGKGRPGL